MGDIGTKRTPAAARRLTLAFGLVASLLVAACAQTQASGTAGGSVATVGGSATRPASAASASTSMIDALIGNAPCRADSECRVIGVGAQACGGPSGYRAWSAAATDGRRLAAVVERDAEIRRTRMGQDGRNSTCEVKPVPAAICLRAGPESPGRCTLAPNRLPMQ